MQAFKRSRPGGAGRRRSGSKKRGSARRSGHSARAAGSNATRTPFAAMPKAAGDQTAHRASLKTPFKLTKSAAAVVIAGANPRIEAIRELQRLPLGEIIVVLESADEGGFGHVRAIPGITILHTNEMLGADVGRAVGARMTSADIILFVDGETPVAAESLADLLRAAEAGCDLVLADLGSQLGPFSDWDDAMRIRAFMNWSLGSPELHANSVDSLPHAWSRQGLEKIGTMRLAVPAQAHRAAIYGNLCIRCCPMKMLAGHSRGSSAKAASQMLSAGDHLEALRAAMREKGARLELPDLVRRRSAAGRDAT